MDLGLWLCIQQLTISGDDLSMFLAVGALLHQLETFGKSPSARRIVTLVILGVLIPVSIYHCWADELYVHQVTFASMVFLCGRKIRKLVRERIPDAEERSRLLSLANGGLGELTVWFLFIAARLT